MAWTTVSKGEYWVVKSETLSVATHTEKDGTAFTVPPGQDFLVGLYHASAASGTVSMDVKASFDNSTFAKITGAAGVLSTVNAAAAGSMSVKVFDISTHGEAPYYKLTINPNASVSDTTLSYVTYVAYHRRNQGKDY